MDELQSQLTDLQAQLAEANGILAPLTNEDTKLNSTEYQLREAYKAQMDEIKAQRLVLNEQKFQIQSKANQLQQQINLINLQAAKAKEEALKAEQEAKAEANAVQKAAVLAQKFDMVTAGAPWREWAKDHQISAGHTLTEDRYVILADPMGLGKTLSSIITADMVEKVTKNASSEFPFLGVEEEVFVNTQTVWTKKAIDCLKVTGLTEWPFNLGKLNSFITFEDDTFKFRTRPITENSVVSYLEYDLKAKLLNEGFIANIEAHYETQVTNAITRPVGRRILYFCPSPLLRNVLEEWRSWAPHRNITYIGGMSKAERNFVLDLTLPKLQDYVIIVNYEAWRRDKQLLAKLIDCDFDTIIIDEAHMIKDRKTASYKGVKAIIEGTNPEYIIPMTGTPILNRPQELFSILTLINPKEFYEERDFLWKYCEEYQTNDSTTVKYKFKEGGLDALAKKIRKNFLRRTKDQAGIVLPEKTIIYHELDRDDETYAAQAKARKHMKEFATIVLDNYQGKAIQATVMIALLTRLRQIETWPAGIIQRDKITKEIILQLDVFESQKIDYIIRKEDDEWEGLIPDTIEDERIVVFSQFKAPLQELKNRVEKAGYRAVILDGSTPSSLRDEIRYDFDRKVTPNRSDSKWDVLLANYKAAGVGLNLTNATQLITLDEEWNPGKREQAWDRIHRIGQTENVTINVVRTKNTVDTWLADIIAAKESVVSGFESAMSMTDLKDALDSGLL